MATIPGTVKWTATPHKRYQINSVDMSASGNTIICGTSKEYDSASDFGVYCYTTDGKTSTPLWNDPLGKPSDQGVFWVAMSGDGNYCAAGGRYSDSAGFLRCYSTQKGPASCFEYPTTSRINQVAIDKNGANIVGVQYGQLVLIQQSGGSFNVASKVDLNGVYADTCAISQDGQWVVVGGGVSSSTYTDHLSRTAERTSSSGGVVYLFQNNAGTLTLVKHWKLFSEVLRVVITPEGDYFAASCKDGWVMLYYPPISIRKDSAIWYAMCPYQGSDEPFGPYVNLTYALAITKTSSGDVYVGAGSNYSSSTSEAKFGYAFMLKNIEASTHTGYKAQQMWQYKLDYCPNPGMFMDTEATYLTATDGQPIFSEKGTSGETSGNFYLLNVSDGSLVWKTPTSIMNWPMTINPQGTCCVGGSDDGSIYYWGVPTSSESS